MDVNEEIKVFVKIRKKIFYIYFFFIYFFFFLGGGSGPGGGGRVGGGGGQGRCKQRSEVFVKIQKKWGVSGRGGHRVDVNKELKFL